MLPWEPSQYPVQKDSLDALFPLKVQVVFDIQMLQKANIIWYATSSIEKKLDGVGPVDNRPSTDKLHHFVRKK